MFLRPLLLGLCLLSPTAAGLARAADAGREDSAPAGLIGLLVSKGIVTQAEAESLQAEWKRASRAAPVAEVVPRGRSTERLAVGLRMQAQAVVLGAEVGGTPVRPPPVQHAFLRRVYLTLQAQLSPNWTALMTYDFASGGYDDAIVQWKARPDLTFDFGLRKVSTAYEERASSGDLHALERSGVTRYFVEPNNGRRLGAASYRLGAFVDGRRTLGGATTLVYGLALTNPERSENFSVAAGSGDAATNRPASWANLGLTGTWSRAKGRWSAGVTGGLLPDQGGRGATGPGSGADLSLYSVYADIVCGRVSLLGEYLAARVERGRAAGGDAAPAGFFLQPGLLLTPNWEAVLRFERLDTDGRGVTLPDVVRSAPATPMMNSFLGWYLGTSWYLRGNDLKYQLGLVYGKTEDTTGGGPAVARTRGVRSQLQVQF